MEDDAKIQNFSTAVRQISIHVPRVEDDDKRQYRYIHSQISIHVPRVEDDLRHAADGAELSISIHVPRVEDDTTTTIDADGNKVFQSTSPVWRTTGRVGRRWSGVFYFNPRPPCGGRLCVLILVQHALSISIHVPRVEDDANRRAKT